MGGTVESVFGMNESQLSRAIMLNKSMRQIPEITRWRITCGTWCIPESRKLVREPSVPGWFEARPVATQIFVPLAINIAGGAMILRAVNSDARLVMLVVLALLLSVLLIAGFVTIDRLLGIVRIQAAPSESVSPSSTLVHEALSSMSRYGFIRNADQVSVIRRRLETAEYVR